jgi:30S ribosomal protein S31
LRESRGSATVRRFEQRTLGENMGKGDLRTRRGKIYNGSYGKKRPHRAKKKTTEPKAPAARR